MKKRYNYEEAVSDAVEEAVELVNTRLAEGWYDVAPSADKFQALAYKALIRRWDKAVVREGPRAKQDTYKLAEQRYLDIFQGVLL